MYLVKLLYKFFVIKNFIKLFQPTKTPMFMSEPKNLQPNINIITEEEEVANYLFVV